MVRVFLTLPMLQAIPAMVALRRAENAPPAPRRPRPEAAAASPSPQPALAQIAAEIAVAEPPIKLLAGEAERRRLELTEKMKVSRVATGPLRPMDLGRRPVAGWGRDAAAEALRFVVHKCEIGAAGLKATHTSLRIRTLAWEEIASLLARQLPADPPWDARILLDVVPIATAADGTEPVRILSTTFVNYAALPGGASTSRLENLRRLVAHLAERNPSAAVDPETAAFLQGDKAPARFATITQFAEYDSRYA
jgi:hypothetical protein